MANEKTQDNARGINRTREKANGIERDNEETQEGARGKAKRIVKDAEGLIQILFVTVSGRRQR